MSHERVAELPAAGAGSTDVAKDGGGHEGDRAGVVPVQTMKRYIALITAGDCEGAAELVAVGNAKKPVAEQFERLRNVAAALAERQRVVRRTVGALSGSHRRVTFATTKGVRSGVVGAVDESGIELASTIEVRGRIVGRTKQKIRWSELAPSQVDELATGWTLATPDHDVAAAFVALERGNADVARMMIASAPKHPLAVYLREKIDATPVGEAPTATPVSRAKPRTPVRTTTRAEPSGLVAHWSFDEDRGSAFADATGNGFDGEAHGGPRRVEGRFGRALLFDGNDDEVRIPKTFDPPDAGTVAYWVKLTKGNGTYRCIGGHDAFESYFEKGGKVTNQFFAADSAYLGSKGKVKPGTWCHVACTYDLASKQNAIYIDGSRDSESTGKADDDPGKITIVFGHRAGASKNQHFSGALDDVRIYDRVLSADDIRSLAERNGQSPAVAPPRRPAPEARPREPKRSAAGAQPTGSGESLVTNGGFEAVEPRTRFARMWHTHEWGTGGAGSSMRLDVSNPHGGERAAVVRAIRNGVEPGVWTTITLDKGTYVVSYWACADIEAKAQVVAHVAGEDLTVQNVGEDWARFAETVTVDKRTPNASLKIRTLTSRVRVWLDDVEVRAAK